MDGCTANSDNYSLVITCEHGGNRIPIRYTDLFKANPVLLNTHRGFDPGALSMAKIWQQHLQPRWWLLL
jgi:predicted N-formylglutamate amidohydrolase